MIITYLHFFTISTANHCRKNTANKMPQAIKSTLKNSINSSNNLKSLTILYMQLSCQILEWKNKLSRAIWRSKCVVNANHDTNRDAKLYQVSMLKICQYSAYPHLLSFCTFCLLDSLLHQLIYWIINFQNIFSTTDSEWHFGLSYANI